MKASRWQLMLGAALVGVSGLLYGIHFFVFRDAHHILIYLLGDIAFVPIEVLLVTLILHRLLENHDKQAVLKKLNMVIGAFFSEVGSRLLESFLTFSADEETFRRDLALTPHWTGRDFARARRTAGTYRYRVDARAGDLSSLKQILVNRRAFMLGLLRNPILLEHESFTDLLWAVFHLTEELEWRSDFAGLPDADLDHIGNDMSRAFSLVLTEWLCYMEHLKVEYPYLYSLATRTNPFNPEATAVIADPPGEVTTVPAPQGMDSTV